MTKSAADPGQTVVAAGMQGKQPRDGSVEMPRVCEMNSGLLPVSAGHLLPSH